MCITVKKNTWKNNTYMLVYKLEDKITVGVLTSFIQKIGLYLNYG
jgi:hypothetical protein